MRGIEWNYKIAWNFEDNWNLVAIGSITIGANMIDILNNEKMDISSEEHLEISPHAEENMNIVEEGDGVGGSSMEEKQLDISNDNLENFASALEMDMLNLKEWFMNSKHTPEEFKGFFRNNYGLHPLHVAAKKGLVDIVDMLITKTKVVVDIQSEEKENGGWTALHFAAGGNHTELVYNLFQKYGANPNVGPLHPLHVAASNGAVHVVDMLIAEMKVDVDIPMKKKGVDEEGWTALHFAARRNHKELVYKLLKTYGADLNVHPFHPLHVAARNGAVDVVDMLIAEMKVDVNIPMEKDGDDEEGWTALHIAASRNHKKLVYKLLKTYGADLNGHAFHPLHVAAMDGAVDVVDMLIAEMKVDVNIPMEKEGAHVQGWTALHFAAGSNHKELVYKLLKTYGADLNMHPFHPLHVAASNGAVDVVDMLIVEMKVDVNIPMEKEGVDEQGWTALHFAAGGNHKSLVHMLLNTYGADLNVHPFHPLHVAAMDGAVDVVDMLIAEMKVDVNIPMKEEGTDEEGWTALHFAARRNHRQLVYKLVKTYGADLNVHPFHPLHVAARNGAVDVVNMLIAKMKVNVNIPMNRKGVDEDGWTALHFAAGGNHTSLVHWLFETYGPHLDVHPLHPLHVAASNGAVDMVDMLLVEMKVDVDIPMMKGVVGEEGWTALHFAAGRNHRELVYKLLNSYGADLNVHPFHPLHVAARNGAVDVVDMLLVEMKVDVDIQMKKTGVNEEGWTALHFAAGKNHKELVYKLLKTYGADLSVHPFHPLHVAARNGAVDVVDMLIAEMKVDVNIPMEKDGDDEEGWTALHIAASRNHKKLVYKLLKTYGADLNGHAFHPLHVAAMDGAVDVVDMLIAEMKVDVNIPMEKEGAHVQGWTALHFAAGSNHKELVYKLLKTYGADLNMHPFHPLHVAASNGAVDVVDMLIVEMKVDVNIPMEKEGVDEQGWTALHFAAGGNHKSLVHMLLNTYGADLNVHPFHPLHVAAMDGAVDVVDMLIAEMKVDVNIPMKEEGTDEEGWTALHFAARRNHRQLVYKLVKTYGADLNVHPFHPLHVAARNGAVDVVNMLIAKMKVNVNIPMNRKGVDEDGWTALHFAAGGNHTSLVHWLFETYGPHLDVHPLHPLHVAASNGAVDVVDMLLVEMKVDVDIPMMKGGVSEEGWTALHFAAGRNHKELVYKLLNSYGADLNVHPFHPLHVAARNGAVDVVDMLLVEMKVDVDIQMKKTGVNEEGWTALHFAAGKNHKELVYKLLKTYGADLSVHPFHPLHVAARNGAVDVVDMLIAEMKVDVNILMEKEGAHEEGWTALHFAAGGNYQEIVGKLLKTYGADLDVHPLHPLHVAAMDGAVDVVDMLIAEMKVDVNILTKRAGVHEGWTALHFAARRNHKELVYKLLKTYGADLNVHPFHPLHVAASNGAVDVVDMLIAEMKVDVNIPMEKEGVDEQGWTALHFAASGNHKSLVHMLLNTYGADLYVHPLHLLHVAAMDGAVDVVDMLITKMKVDVNIPMEKEGADEEGWTALHFAASRNHKELVYKLVKTYGADLNVHPFHPLHVAARNGAEDVVNMLKAEMNVDVNIPMKKKGVNEEGWTALHFAAGRNHKELVYKLLKTYGADLNVHHFHPLHVAARNGAVDVVDMLIAKMKVDVNIPVKKEGVDEEGWSALHFAAGRNHKELVYKLLKTYGANLNVHHFHPLHVAARNGAVDVVDMLIAEMKVDVNIPMEREGVDEEGWTALHFAASGNHQEIVGKLLKTYGANVDVHPLYPLHVAARNGAVDVVDMLIVEMKVDVNIPMEKDGADEEGWTALHFAAAGNRQEIVSKLLKTYGADVDVHPLHPLHVAARNGAMDVVNMLITEMKVHVDIPMKKEGADEEGWTALHFAACKNQEEMVDMLLVKYGANPNVLRPLHLAVKRGAVDIVDMLITKAKLDVNIPTKMEGDEEGWTALHYAVKGDQEEMVYKLLVKYGADPNVHGRGAKFIFFLARLGGCAVKGFLRAERELCHQLNVNATNSRDSPISTSGKINVNVIDEDGRTALHLAAFHKSKDSVKALHTLLNFPDIKLTIEDKAERTALDVAAGKKNWEVFNILRLKITSEVKDYNEPYYKDRQASVDAANAILVGAALIASVTFAAWLQPPLGYSTFYNEQFFNNLPGPPTSNPQYASFDHHPMLKWFWAFNSLSFFLAIATVMSGAQSVLPSHRITVKQEVAKLQRNLVVTSTLLALSMVFVLLAFAIAGIIVIPPIYSFRASMYYTIVVGGGVSGVFLLRLILTILRTISILWDKKPSKIF